MSVQKCGFVCGKLWYILFSSRQIICFLIVVEHCCYTGCQVCVSTKKLLLFQYSVNYESVEGIFSHLLFDDSIVAVIGFGSGILHFRAKKNMLQDSKALHQPQCYKNFFLWLRSKSTENQPTSGPGFLKHCLWIVIFTL